MTFAQGWNLQKKIKMTRASADDKPVEKDGKKAEEGVRQKLTVGVPEETVQNFDDLLEICGEAGAWQLKVIVTQSILIKIIINSSQSLQISPELE